MSVVAVEGFIDNGVVRISDGLSLPQGTRVYVVVPDSADEPVASIRSPRLVRPEQASDFRMKIAET